MNNKHAVIISQHSTASAQISDMLEKHGWQPVLINPKQNLERLQYLSAAILVIDLDDPDCMGLEILRCFNISHPLAYSVGLCRSGNYPAMRQARELGIDGFFYLNRMRCIDFSSGLGSYFSLQQQKINRTRPSTTVMQMS